MTRRPAGPTSRDGGRRPRPAALPPQAATSPKPPAPKPPAKPADPDLVLMGEFGRAQGLHGEVRLKSFTSDPQAIASYGTLTTADGRALTLAEVRPAPGAASDMLIARVQGVTGRTAAEALNRLAIYIPRTRLGTPEEEDEFFTTDLIGTTAVDAAGTIVATVVAVPNYGGGDLLELRPAAGGATALLPFTKAFVPTLDLPARRITVALPEDFFEPPGQKPADDPG
ncbi:ribosome maturation factor RimM [Methylobacterium aerolatum]|uniref:Ribosome maturation factor RimM n=1 Tax=Methylobacterium aerolatum TaxID=418708 RepID=A0ABU0HXY6_9HYPH|nr:ribosome maturation factor RimM [Methylobacterium aerolatum]MDQ0446575.1 16S rRNA processing protein RimM [Methylobacterium aerolatum]GJD33265.1 Ribosome maturation factor RimM [Methylobacterium aerolatum]